MISLQKFASVHSSVQNLFNTERSLSSRDTYKASRTATLAEWRHLDRYLGEITWRRNRKEAGHLQRITAVLASGAPPLPFNALTG